MQSTIFWHMTMALLTAASLSAQLSSDEKQVERHGQTVLQVRHSYQFAHSSMLYRYHVLEPDQRLMLGKWGDYFLGLQHGTVNNGSWCNWNFLQAHGLVAGKQLDLLRQRPPLKTGMIHFAGGDLAEIIWEGELRLRMIQLEALPEWLFGRLEFPETVELEQITLAAWPGGTHWEAEGRERRLRNETDDYLLKTAAQPIAFQADKANALALYNRNYSERNGNFLIFKGGEVESLQANAGSNNKVQLLFRPLAETREFCFALGYFRDANPEESVSRFLVEQAPNLIDRFNQINWQPRFDLSDFQRDWEYCRELLGILKQSEVPELVERSQKETKHLQTLQQDFQRGVRENDPGLCSQVLQQLDKLRLQWGQAWLQQLQ